jgi:hypothetical protein
MINYLSAGLKFNNGASDITMEIFHGSKTHSLINIYIFHPCLFSFIPLSTIPEAYVAPFFSQIMYDEKESHDFSLLLLSAVCNYHHYFKYLTSSLPPQIYHKKVYMRLQWMDIYAKWNFHFIIQFM